MVNFALELSPGHLVEYGIKPFFGFASLCRQIESGGDQVLVLGLFSLALCLPPILDAKIEEMLCDMIRRRHGRSLLSAERRERVKKFLEDIGDFLQGVARFRKAIVHVVILFRDVRGQHSQIAYTLLQ